MQWNATDRCRDAGAGAGGGALMAFIAVVRAGESAGITYTFPNPLLLCVSVTHWSSGTSSHVYDLQLGQLRWLPPSPHLGAVRSSQIQVGLIVTPSIAGISITDIAHLHPSGPRVPSVGSVAGFGRLTRPAANARWIRASPGVEFRSINGPNGSSCSSCTCR